MADAPDNTKTDYRPTVFLPRTDLPVVLDEHSGCRAGDDQSDDSEFKFGGNHKF